MNFTNKVVLILEEKLHFFLNFIQVKEIEKKN